MHARAPSQNRFVSVARRRSLPALEKESTKPRATGVPASSGRFSCCNSAKGSTAQAIPVATLMGLLAVAGERNAPPAERPARQ